ncbi:unnamed protein product [Orchesella dallaii]|uniref:Uncharacterized protein n=1 Tax=Orchesella dallaii TaxID=48710 RepID=A0ABP1RQ08_9HEXA
MSVTKGSLQINEKTLTVSGNRYENGPYAKWIFLGIRMTIVIASVIFLEMFISLVASWKERTNDDMLQLATFVLLLPALEIAYAASTMLETNAPDLIFIVRERFRLINPTKAVRKTHHGIDLVETCVYVFSSAFAAFPLTLGLYPFVIKNEPLSKFIHFTTFQFFTEVDTYSRIFASILYGPIASHCAATILFVLLCTAMFGEGMQQLSWIFRRVSDIKIDTFWNFVNTYHPDFDDCPCKFSQPNQTESSGEQAPASGIGSRIRDALDRTSIYLKCRSEVEAGCLASKDFIGCFYRCEKTCKFRAGIDVESEEF